MHTLEASSARLAAARAVQSGNDQLLAVRGYAIDIPGVPDVQAAKKKYGIVIILIVAAIVTPPDVVSQITVAVPMLLIYEGCIWISAVVEKNKKKNEQIILKA